MEKNWDYFRILNMLSHWCTLWIIPIRGVTSDKSSQYLTYWSKIYFQKATHGRGTCPLFAQPVMTVFFSCWTEKRRRGGVGRGRQGSKEPYYFILRMRHNVTPTRPINIPCSKNSPYLPECRTMKARCFSSSASEHCCRSLRVSDLISDKYLCSNATNMYVEFPFAILCFKLPVPWNQDAPIVPVYIHHAMFDLWLHGPDAGSIL